MPDSESDSQPDDTMRERVPGSGPKIWFLLGADRWLVTVVLLVGSFVALVVAGSLHPTPAFTLLTRGDSVETLFQALVTSTITGVTLVLTLSQLILSQELGSVGDQRERMKGAMAFREDVESRIDAGVSPPEPSAFLRELVGTTRDRAETLADSVSGRGSLDDRVHAYADDVVDNAEAVLVQLEDAQFGEFDVVWAALNYNYSWKIYAGRRIRAEYPDELSDEAKDALDELVDALELFAPAREHFKTLYFQWELSDLSRRLLFAAVPALLVAITALLFLDAQDLTGATLGVSDALLAVSVAVTISIAPFVILLSYILRIVTITKRTLSIGSFILRDTDRSTDIDWE